MATRPSRVESRRIAFESVDRPLSQSGSQSVWQSLSQSVKRSVRQFVSSPVRQFVMHSFIYSLAIKSDCFARRGAAIVSRILLPLDPPPLPTLPPFLGCRW